MTMEAQWGKSGPTDQKISNKKMRKVASKLNFKAHVESMTGEEMSGERAVQAERRVGTKTQTQENISLFGEMPCFIRMQQYA